MSGDLSSSSEPQQQERLPTMLQTTSCELMQYSVGVSLCHLRPYNVVSSALCMTMCSDWRPGQQCKN